MNGDRLNTGEGICEKSKIRKWGEGSRGEGILNMKIGLWMEKGYGRGGG